MRKRKHKMAVLPQTPQRENQHLHRFRVVAGFIHWEARNVASVRPRNLLPVLLIEEAFSYLTSL